MATPATKTNQTSQPKINDLSADTSKLFAGKDFKAKSTNELGVKVMASQAMSKMFQIKTIDYSKKKEN